ncbi:Corticosteroid-binding protein [Spathaspora sp. JA1]|nr:Corticosteroid-binding protein [Spathaspora sp. JA1]
MLHKKVVIIGGGISGVKAAIDLYQAGITDTIIVESRDRLGGRLFTINSEHTRGLNYDMGASWFHDTLNNPLFEKAIEYKTVKYHFDDGKCQYVSNEDEDIPTWKFQAIVDEMRQYFELTYAKDPTKPDVSLKRLCEEYITKFNSRLTQEQQEYARGVIRALAELYHGESWDTLSGRFCFTNMNRHVGRSAFVENGYYRVFQMALKELPRKYLDTNVKLNAHVYKIDYSGSKILVHLFDGRSYSCDYLISTIPQSILQITDPKDSCYLKWEPELPLPLRQVLPDIHFGSLGKLVFEFNECFWPEDVERFYAISTKTNIPELSIKAWDFPSVIVNYQAIMGLPSLVILTQNPLSKYIEQLSKDEKFNEIWSLFKPMLEQISQQDSIPDPIAIYNSPWNGEYLTRGSYGTTPIGMRDPADINRVLNQGFQNRIRFAGAETIIGSANGCAHGGWFSGQREAKFIIDNEKKSKL